MTLYEHFTDKQWKLLEQRAQRVEKAVTAQDKRELEQVLVVKVGREAYALPVEMVQTVYEQVVIRPLPSTPDYIVGIANVRGHITTILSIPQILDTPMSPLENTGLLILLALPSDHIAIYVQSVLDVREISNQQIMPISNKHDAYINGVLDDGTIYLNIQAIVNDTALIIDQ